MSSNLEDPSKLENISNSEEISNSENTKHNFFHKIPGLKSFSKNTSLAILIIIISVIILALFLSGTITPSTITSKIVCGDGICETSSESCLSCPQDCSCPPQIKDVIVRVGRTTENLTVENLTLNNSLTVTLFDENGDPLSELEGRQTEFKFDNITTTHIYAEATGQFGNKVRGPYIGVQDITTNSIIHLTLPTNFFSLRKNSKFGTVKVVISDNKGQKLEASVTLMDSSNTAKETITGRVVSFYNVKANEHYYLVAKASGFEEFSNINEKFLLKRLETKTITVSLHSIDEPVITEVPISLPDHATIGGNLRVCVRDERGAVQNGIVRVFDASGKPIADGDMRGCSIERGGSSTVGCRRFNLPPFQSYYASLLHTRCTDVTSNPVPVLNDLVSDIILKISCVKNIKAQIEVIGSNDEPLTADASITIYADEDKIPGTNPDGTLATLGRATEEIILPSDTDIYVWARDVPGYSDTKSKKYKLKPDEQQPVLITMTMKEDDDNNNITNGTEICSSGDVNADGVVDCDDLTCILLHTSGVSSCIQETNTKCADLAPVNESDNIINMEDALALLDILNSQGLSCEYSECWGDVDLDGARFTQNDSIVLNRILTYLNNVGKPYPNKCADANNDNYITTHDKNCLDFTLEGRPQDCVSCRISDAFEICTNGLDDNCDGQIDTENYVNDVYYAGTAGLCDCNLEMLPSIPCGMKWDSSGSGGGPYLYCRSINDQIGLYPISDVNSCLFDSSCSIQPNCIQP